MKKMIVDIIIIILVIMAFIGILFVMYFSIQIYRDVSIYNDVNDMISSYEDYDDHWSKLYEINNDIFAILEFDSGLIIEPVVQTVDNEYYLNHSIDGKENTQGTVFIDSNYAQNDDVKIIYGHNVYYDKNAMFSPLELLFDQKTYEENSCFFLKYQTHQDKYKIFACIEYDIYSNEFDYQIDKFDDVNMFDEWIGYILENNVLSPEDDQYLMDDEYVILQTCKKWNDDIRLLIIAKKI